MLEDIEMVDFAAGRFITAWVIANLEIGHMVPGAIDIENNITVLNLLMISIKENF